MNMLFANGSTRVDQVVQCRPLSLWAKLMFPLSKLMAGPMKKCMEQDLDDLAGVLTERTATPAAEPDADEPASS